MTTEHVMRISRITDNLSCTRCGLVPLDRGDYETPCARVLEIRYTGTLIIPDGSDTNGYGEPCLEGHGYEIATGWVIPSWSLFQVHEDRPTDPVDVIDLGDRETRHELEDRYGGDLEALVRDRVGDVIGFIDHETGDGTYYGGTEHTDYGTGETVILAAHVDGLEGEL